MSYARRIAPIVIGLLVVIAPLCHAGEYKGEIEGVWMSAEEIDIKAYGVEAYLDYLGKGYIPLLEKVKAEGLVVDYGVLVKTTGGLGKGDVVIWWTTKSLADLEKAGERMEELGEEMFTGEEWQEMWSKMAEIRTPRTANLLRAVTWTKKEETP